MKKQPETTRLTLENVCRRGPFLSWERLRENIKGVETQIKVKVNKHGISLPRIGSASLDLSALRGKWGFWPAEEVEEEKTIQ